MLKRTLMVWLLVVSCALPILGGNTVFANISSCSASVNPSTMQPGSSGSFQFVVNNTDNSSIQWISITSPSTNYTVNGGSGGGWNQVSNDDASATFQSGSIDPGLSSGLSVSVSTDTSTHPAEIWTVLVSDEPDGNNPYNCGGDLSTNISGQVPDTTPPNIYNVSVTPLSLTGVNVSWLTDEASTSQIDYGEDASYGNTDGPDSSFVTDHSVVIAGLSANTGYHFTVSSADVSGNIGFSNDNTFLTQAPLAKAIGNNKAASLPIDVPITNPADKTPPTITLISALPHVVQYVPTISGTATDELAVTRIEYSTNNGHDWLPVDSAPGIGGKTVNFTFTPSNLDDGNYKIIARAIDAGGNITATTPVEMVIDRLPPLVGGSVISIGPQVLNNSNGAILTQAGVDEKITLSAVGGPTTISLTAQGQAKGDNPQTFGLSQSPDSGLWSGIISFKKAGKYTLTANSIDGAGNKTTKQISKVTALPAGQLTDSKTKKPVSGQVTIFTMRPDSSDWAVWDGAPYGQPNPQPVAKEGRFSFLLPAGKYYLSASASKHHNFVGDIFVFKQPSPLSTTININPGRNFKLLSWLSWSSQNIHLNNQAVTNNDTGSSLVGNLAPSFALKDVSGRTVQDVDLLGKPTDLVFMNTWAPTTSEQLPILSSLAGYSDVNIKPVAAQESIAKLRAYNGISGYSLNWLADPNSTTTGSFATPSLPTHYFIDRNGTVKQVISGLLSKQDLLSRLSKL